jgi:hypothetical protein
VADLDLPLYRYVDCLETEYHNHSWIAACNSPGPQHLCPKKLSPFDRPLAPFSRGRAQGRGTQENAQGNVQARRIGRCFGASLRRGHRVHGRDLVVGQICEFRGQLRLAMIISRLLIR